MTSPVDTSVKYFTNRQTLSPVISGTAGSLIAALDACLVNGFGALAATIVVSGGVATVTTPTPHSALPLCVVLIAGCTGAWTPLNGEQKVVTTLTTQTMTFATAVADGTATGSITVKMAPAGWTKVYSGTNKAVYQSSDPLSTRMLLRVDDTGTTDARVVGYESMTDIDTGAGAFPTALQVSGGGYWTKSINANSAGVGWSIVADGRAFFFNAMCGQSTNAAYRGCANRFFGDLVPYKVAGDAYACALNVSTSVTLASRLGDSIANNSYGSYMPRDYTGLGSSVFPANYGFTSSINATVITGSDATLGSFPSAVDGALWFSTRYITTASNTTPRALIPGLASVPQNGLTAVFNPGDIVPGAGVYAGKNFCAEAAGASNSSFNATGMVGILFFDVTGPWR